MRKTISLAIFLCAASAAFAAEAAPRDIDIFSAPDGEIGICAMNAAADMREASVWLMSSPNQKLFVRLEPSNMLAPKTVSANKDGIALVKFEALKPGTKYSYKISASEDGKNAFEGSFKTSPDYEGRFAPPPFKIAILGKTHRNDPVYDEPFKTPGGGYEIFGAVKNQKPDAIVWAHNAAILRPSDWGSRGGIFARYRAERADPALKEMLVCAPNYGVMSADAYGAPGSDKSLWNRRDAVEAFKSFWGNPSFGVGSQENLATYFRFSDVDVFILDDATNRNNLDYKNSRPEMFGEEQLNWLALALKNSKAKFKLVISNSPITNPVEAKGNFAFYKRERKYLLDFLLENKIGGVVFVSANKDYGEITRMQRAGAYRLLEITAGPATARPAQTPTEMNFFRASGTLVTERSFATITFEGEEGDRRLKIEAFNSAGKNLLTETVKASELYLFE
ncbi:MAG: alkaline phosphatase D family protein [Opitutales bacterium]|nr:alkaline phosphatase D family protein [Opitutales bacterium]